MVKKDRLMNYFSFSLERQSESGVVVVFFFNTLQGMHSATDPNI